MRRCSSRSLKQIQIFNENRVFFSKKLWESAPRGQHWRAILLFCMLYDYSSRKRIFKVLKWIFLSYWLLQGFSMICMIYCNKITINKFSLSLLTAFIHGSNRPEESPLIEIQPSYKMLDSFDETSLLPLLTPSNCSNFRLKGIFLAKYSHLSAPSWDIQIAIYIRECSQFNLLYLRAFVKLSLGSNMKTEQHYYRLIW